jgi:hypothetical protein
MSGMKKIIPALIIFLSSALHAQWIEGTRTQTDPNSNNGCLYVNAGVMYYWNYENYMQKSLDNGKTWIDLLDSGLGVQGPGLSRSMVQMQYHNGRLYGAFNYGTSGSVLYSTDDGNHWEPDTLGAPPGQLSTDPHPNVTQFCAWGKWLYVKFAPTGAYYIREEGKGFVLDTFLNAAINHPNGVLAVGDTLFCLCPNYGLCYTTDGGKSYTRPLNTGFLGNLAEWFYRDGSRIYAFMNKQGCVMLYTDDAGNSWHQIDISPVSSQHQVNGNVVSVIAAYIKGNFVELSLQQNHFNQAPNLWKSTDLGKTWSVDTLGLPNLYVGSINYLDYTPDGYLWAVRDHWKIYKEKIDNGTTNNVVIAPSQNSNIKIMPNPCHDYFSLIMPENSGGSYEISDLLGRLLQQGTLTDRRQSISVAGMASGQYKILVKAQGGERYISTIVVQ